MPDVVFKVDQSKSMREQDVPGHNRWHPDIPPAVTVRPGSEVRIESREWMDGQVGNNDSANDIRDLNLNVNHMLSGPIGVEGAEPGDLLVVDILDIGPVPQETGDVAGQGWGYTGIFAKGNGGGFLTDWYPDACKAIWDFHGQIATSRHIPGVRFTDITHPGLIGTAPDHDMLARWNRRGELEYLRRAGSSPDERVREAIALVESKRDSEGRWPLEVQYPGQMPVQIDDGVGRPSRWNTLRALRVLKWYSDSAG